MIVLSMSRIEYIEEERLRLHKLTDMPIVMGKSLCYYTVSLLFFKLEKAGCNPGFLQLIET